MLAVGRAGRDEIGGNTMHDDDRSGILTGLKHIAGRQGNPHLKIFLEREDGQLDCTDGRVYPSSYLTGKGGSITRALIEEVSYDPFVEYRP
jgi:hypothetical protein